MTEPEIATIGKLIDLCRSKRVRVLANDGFRIELELEPVTEPEPKGSTKPAVDPSLCRCGHPEHMHTNGACLSGCTEDKCLAPEDRP